SGDGDGALARLVVAPLDVEGALRPDISKLVRENFFYFQSLKVYFHIGENRRRDALVELLADLGAGAVEQHVLGFAATFFSHAVNQHAVDAVAGAERKPTRVAAQLAHHADDLEVVAHISLGH